MSGLMLDTTYNDLINTVADWLVTNCHNVGTMRLPSCFQSNYTRTTSVHGSGSGYTPSYTIKPKTYASLVSRNTVVSELQAFYQARGITNLNSIIQDNKFLACINNLVSFICTKVCFVVSPYNSANDTINANNQAVTTFGNITNYIAYFSTNTNFPTLEDMSATDSNEKVIMDTDINNINNILLNIINNRIHTKQINYTITFN